MLFALGEVSMRNISSLTLRRLAVVAATVGVLSLMAAPSAQAYISRPDALDRTFNYAKQQCFRDGRCKRYGANRCFRQNHGVACFAWNYELSRRSGKFVCRRTVLWHSRYNREFLTGWKCFKGWNRGPYA